MTPVRDRVRDVRFRASLQRAIFKASFSGEGSRAPAPQGPTAFVYYGWLESLATAVARVASVAVPGEWNYLVNPDPPILSRSKLKTLSQTLLYFKFVCFPLFRAGEGEVCSLASRN